MGLKKGQTNNPNGRPKGARNERSKQWEELGEYLTTGAAERVKEYLDNINDESEHYEQYLKLLNYFKPKMQSTTAENINKVEITNVDPFKQIRENAGLETDQKTE